MKTTLLLFHLAGYWCSFFSVFMSWLMPLWTQTNMHNLIKIKVEHAKWDGFQNNKNRLSNNERKKSRAFQNAENVLNPEMDSEQTADVSACHE